MSDSRPLKRSTHFQISCIGFLVVVGVIFIIYFPTLSFEFTNWDDPSYVQEIQAIRNPGWLGIKEVLTKPLPASHGDYIPVTIFSYWMDYQVWGFQPKGYHLTNLFLHALSAGLLFLLLQRLTASPAVSMMATLLFALHPMNTEAVTWIAERKNVTGPGTASNFAKAITTFGAGDLGTPGNPNAADPGFQAHLAVTAGIPLTGRHLTLRVGGPAQKTYVLVLSTTRAVIPLPGNVTLGVRVDGGS